MRALDQVDLSSSLLARNALTTAAVLAVAGSGLGVAGILQGGMPWMEQVLVLCGGTFGVAMLLTLLFFRRVPTQWVALVSVAFYGAYLSAGLLIALLGRRSHEDALIYLQWFFPLLLLNRMVNAPAAGRMASHVLLAAPLLIISLLFRRVIVMNSPTMVYLTLVACLSYVLFALMLNAVSRYREAYIVEIERTESLRMQSQVLESISDCFVSMDADFTLTYVNDAACAELGVRRDAVTGESILNLHPGLFSRSVLHALTLGSGGHHLTVHEVQTEEGQWYEMRCFSHPERISIWFRNISDVVRSRKALEAAHERLRQQSELLDKAQDAIFVQDMESRVLYWNKGAEALFGWTADEVSGKRVGEIFAADRDPIRSAFDATLRDGEWSGEIQKKRRDGKNLVVQSRAKLLRDDAGNPQSILAINTDVTDRKVAENRIHNLAFYDHLTGLANRMLLADQLERILTYAAFPEKHGALLFIDLDDFKTLNDTAGHEEGDGLLKEIAHRLRLCVRKSDSVARFGGDEFVVLLEGLNEDQDIAVAEARSVAEKILHACRKPYATPHCAFESTASIGIALFQPHRVTVDDLLKRADLAMYQAKAQGRNSMCLFDASMEVSASARAVLLSDLRGAIQKEEFELHYQPQLDSHGRITGCEALVRWRHPQRGMISPGEFIPLAESSGLIVDLGSWVLKAACSQVAQWARHPEMCGLHLSVNVSPRQFLDAKFEQHVAQALAESGIDPSHLNLEITESVMVENIEETLSTMTALKAIGVGFSLDDFGTGYSSLSQLKRLPLDQLKIDQSFVRDLMDGQTDASIVRTIIGLARNLDLNVIAEGVETPPQRAFLEEHGCHAFQGYLFSPALPPVHFETFVRELSSTADSK